MLSLPETWVIHRSRFSWLLIGSHWWIIDYNVPKIGCFFVEVFSTKHQKVSNKKGPKDKVIENRSWWCGTPTGPFCLAKPMYQGCSFVSLDCRMSDSSVMRRLIKLAFRLNACIFIVEIVQKVTRSHGPLRITESFLMKGFCLRLICMLFGMSLQGLLSPPVQNAL